MDDKVLDSAHAEHGLLLLRQLERMRTAEELTDVVLLAEGIPFPCHKVVLSAFSPYFQVKGSCTYVLKVLDLIKENAGCCEPIQAHLLMLW